MAMPIATSRTGMTRGITRSLSAPPIRSVRFFRRRLTLRLRSFILPLAFLLLSAPAWAQVSDDQLVDNAYPPELYASRDPEAPSHFSTYVTADLNHNGQTLLVALYTNGTRAGISVLDRSGRVLSHPDLRFLKGFRGEIETIDLDGDG